MKLKTIAILILVSALFMGCSNGNGNDEANKDDVTDIKELVHDYSVGNVEAASASITSSELVVTDENKNQTTYDLPDDEFFVSIAPFINETHPCDIHSLTGCQGELVKEDVEVHIEDSAGNVILDETKQTEANGFIDLWLPRNDTFSVTIFQDGKKSSSEISTFDGDNTCITTMRLN
ncbi:CueP family metal-binding protein [Virgibacillus sp. 179-BFC.A HS]|uniref:CueP family metal-binding protein n=1 Tax=Tigheibacillus jepli TaxID=3035914 RepID=A0ABU5CLG4_9BACI|nr:CueP family metal-binding protein [Virgibacillus sp. 179-BFC.A HS]MDY0407175.1 CueP family metal-binding protein [Virgibacillus sp. 179-BFC.A HS]